MRRLLLLALVTSVAVAAALAARGAHAGSTYGVDAVFDTAKGLIPGQLVKIAGARAGTIEDISLTRDYKARIHMQVDARFAPFRVDATCSIQPQALIAENFVACDPGSGRPLRPVGGYPPTVPVTRTSVPANLTDLFQIWSVPVRERLPLVISTLGAGFAGRGGDFNAILHRANPALAATRRAIRLVDAERARLSRLVVDSDALLASLAKHRAGVAGFIGHGAGVAAATASRRVQLAEAVRRLPALLDAARPALRRLDELAASGTPIVRDLRASAPGLNQLLTELRPFAAAARPALRSLGSTAQQARRAARHAAPVVRKLARFSGPAIPTGRSLDALFTSMRDRGFVEGLLTSVYRFAAASARYDSVSHLLPVAIGASSCSLYATVPVAPCSASFASQPPSSTRANWPRAPAINRPLHHLLDYLLR
jgi:ABC-type transporter Mla subunit MlaD